MGSENEGDWEGKGKAGRMGLGQGMGKNGEEDRLGKGGGGKWQGGGILPSDQYPPASLHHHRLDGRFLKQASWRGQAAYHPSWRLSGSPHLKPPVLLQPYCISDQPVSEIFDEENE